MSTTQLKKEFNTYLPMLNMQQQQLLLDMVKNILQVEPNSDRISLNKYNAELEHSSKQIDEGKFALHKIFLKSINNV